MHKLVCILDAQAREAELVSKQLSTSNTYNAGGRALVTPVMRIHGRAKRMRTKNNDECTPREWRIHSSEAEPQI